MARVNKIVTLDKLSIDLVDKLSSCEVVTISLNDDIDRSFEDVDAFILNTKDPTIFFSFVKKIRSSV